MTPPRNPWIQTGTGIAFDLIEPRPEMVNFEVDIAEGLSRIARFNGHVRSGPYSVAQHSVMGADFLLRETGDETLAAAFLLHDAHEAYIGDIATPVKWALAATVHSCNTQPCGVDVLRAGLTRLRTNIDFAIFAAAGLLAVLESEEREIKQMDLRMMMTERRHLLGPSPFPWGEEYEAIRPLRITGKFTVWPWPKAADEFRARCRRWLPVFQKSRRPAA